MAPRIPFGFHEFEEALSRAIDMEEKNGAYVVDKAPVISTEKLDFNAIMSEAREIWTSLVNKAQTDEEKADIVRIMSKKVEMIFGQKIKLSEVTDNQVDLLNLALLDLRDLRDSMN